jgi:aminoglycoside 6-adenylyltransferase
MRSEEEMLDLILNYARRDEDVRAAVMNGSRVNSNARIDPFQDYDIIYFVRNVEPYRHNWELTRYFGELMILQTPEDMSEPPAANKGFYSYLMQFKDGNRIDLSFYSINSIPECMQDTLTVMLIDKDNLIGKLPPPSDRGYLPQRPTVKAFDDCCNEFWWLNPYVAKGLWRDELTYARYMLDTLMREQLMKMLIWYYGTNTNFEKSPGKLGKYLKGQIEDELWTMLEGTYADANLDHTWEALFAMGDLFRRVAQPVADHLGYIYPEQEDRNVSEFIRRIKQLPRDAKTI